MCIYIYKVLYSNPVYAQKMQRGTRDRLRAPIDSEDYDPLGTKPTGVSVRLTLKRNCRSVCATYSVVDAFRAHRFSPSAPSPCPSSPSPSPWQTEVNPLVYELRRDTRTQSRTLSE